MYKITSYIIAVLITGSIYYTYNFAHKAGYKTGFQHGSDIRQNKLTDYTDAVKVILSAQKTWRPQYHTFHEDSCQTQIRRQGFWTYLFKPNIIGAIAYVVWHGNQNKRNKKNREVCLLMTLQKRVVHNKLITVCEPPGGKIPHTVVENAEREIEQKANKNNNPCFREQAYARAMEKYQKGNISHSNYVVDENLLDTAKREVKEETGFDLNRLQSPHQTKVKISKFTCLEKEGYFFQCYRFDIWSQDEKPPTLTPLDRDESLHAEWVPLNKIDMSARQITISQGNNPGVYPIKPHEWLVRTTEKVLNGIKEKCDRGVF